MQLPFVMEWPVTVRDRKIPFAVNPHSGKNLVEIPGTLRTKRLERLSICSQTPFISPFIFLSLLGIISERGFRVQGTEEK